MKAEPSVASPPRAPLALLLLLLHLGPRGLHRAAAPPRRLTGVPQVAEHLSAVPARPCIAECGDPTIHACSFGLVGHLCAVLCELGPFSHDSRNLHCALGPGTEAAAQALQLAYAGDGATHPDQRKESIAPCSACAPDGCDELCRTMWGPAGQRSGCYTGGATCLIDTPNAQGGLCCDCPGALCRQEGLS